MYNVIRLKNYIQISKKIHKLAIFKSGCFWVTFRHCEKKDLGIMKYLSVQQVADKFGVTVRAVQKWAKEGKIDGAMRIGKVWLIPENVVRPYDFEHKTEVKKTKHTKDMLPSEGMRSYSSLNTIFDIINGKYKPGQANDFIQKIDNPKIRTVAEGELMYFKANFVKSAEILHAHISDSDDALAFYAGTMYAFSNFMTERHNVAQIGFEGLRKYMNSVNEKDEEKYAMVVFVFSFVDVLLHSDKADITKLQATMHNFPMGMRLFAAYIMAHYECFKHDYSKALGIADAAIALSSSIYPIPMIYLHIIAAVCLINMKNIQEAKARFYTALDLASGDGFWSPFIEHHGMLLGLVEVCMKETHSSEFRKIIEHVRHFGHGWHRIRHSEGVTIAKEELTVTEFVVAMLFSKEWSMKEISAYLNISLRMIKQHLSTIYLKLGITRRDELKERMLK